MNFLLNMHIFMIWVCFIKHNINIHSFVEATEKDKEEKK